VTGSKRLGWLELAFLTAALALAVLILGRLLFPHDPVNLTSYSAIKEGMKEEEVRSILGRAADEEIPGHQMIQPAGGTAPRIQCWWGIPAPMDRWLGPYTRERMLAVGLTQHGTVQWKVFKKDAKTYRAW